MSTLAETLLAKVLELPPMDRIALANQVFESVDPRDCDFGIDPAWAAELERRAVAAERGELTHRSLADAKAFIRESFNAGKPS